MRISDWSSDVCSSDLWKTIAEWRALGLVPQGRAWPSDPDMLATLLEPDGPGATAYLLTGNYRVILDYNCSNFYALSVGLLADAVEHRSEEHTSELQSLMRISYAVFCLKKKHKHKILSHLIYITTRTTTTTLNQ